MKRKPSGKEVEQCIFYRVNIKESYVDWKNSMKRLGFLDESIEEAARIIRENNWELHKMKDKNKT